MANLAPSNVISRQQWHSTMTEENHLGAALLLRPDVQDDKMMKVFSAYRYSDNALTGRLMNLGKTKELGTSELTWKLRGASTRPSIVVENVLPAANTTPGIGITEFTMKLDWGQYLPGDVISPGTMDKKHQVRIQKNLGQHGAGTLYRVIPNTKDKTYSLPVKFLASGTRWGKLFAQYEEGAEQSGSTSYSMPQELITRLSRYRKKYQVTGDAASDVLAVQIPDSNGKMNPYWVQYAEAEFWQQWYREIDRGCWYSRSTDQVFGSTGRAVFSGAGVQELLEDSPNTTVNPNELTATLFEEAILDMIYGRITPGSGREFELYTGEYGMIRFHRAVQSKFEQSGWLQIVDDKAIQNVASPYHKNGLSFGYQFVQYRGANGITLNMIHNPAYDDREVNFDIDPRTGFPYESMRYTLMDVSGEGVESNVQLLTKKNSMKLAYVSGLHGPYGPSNKTHQPAHDGDYYTMTVSDMKNIHIHDTSRCLEIKPAVVS